MRSVTAEVSATGKVTEANKCNNTKNVSLTCPKDPAVCGGCCLPGTDVGETLEKASVTCAAPEWRLFELTFRQAGCGATVTGNGGYGAEKCQFPFTELTVG